MFPAKIAVTFCQSCEAQLTENQLCSPGCVWDGTTNVRKRPVVVRVYWYHQERDPQSPGRKAYEGYPLR